MASSPNDLDLEVIRVSKKSGFWLWRGALYKVLEKKDGQPARIVVTGRFRSHKEAMNAARKLLA